MRWRSCRVSHFLGRGQRVLDTLPPTAWRLLGTDRQGSAKDSARAPGHGDPVTTTAARYRRKEHHHAEHGGHPRNDRPLRRPECGRRATRRVALARLISVTGSQAAHTALLIDVFARSGNAVWVSIAAFSSVGVLGLVSPLAGAVADRYDPRQVMIVAELAGAVTYLFLLLPIGTAPSVAVVMVSTALNAPVRAASAGLLPSLVGSEDLTWANGLLSGSFSAGLLAGPVLGGALTAASDRRRCTR